MSRLQKKLAVLALALGLTLCACTKQADEDPAQQALAFRQDVMQNTYSFRADVSADFGDTVCQFTLSCVHTPGSGTEMTITAPETLAGLTAMASDEGAKLVFDGAEAAFGTLEGLGLSPMTAPELLAESWETGYIQYTGTEDGLLRVTYLCGYEEDEYRADTWFQDGAPVRAELSCDGRMAVQIDVTDFNLRKAETNNESTQTNMGRYLAGQSGA